MLMKSRVLLYIFVLFAFLKPAGFDLLGYSAINTFFNILRIVLAILIFLYYIIKGKKSICVHYELLFFIPLGISSLVNNYGIENYLIFAGSIIALTMYIETMIENNVKSFIYSLFYTYFLLIAANYVYMISIGGFIIDVETVRPDLFSLGSGSVVTILSSVNGVASYIFPAILSCILMMSITTYNNIVCWILIVLCFLSELFLWSATSLTGVFLLILYILFVYNNTNLSKKLVKPKLLLFITLFISLGITFFNIQNWFGYIITDILHKDLTMTGRTNVWEIGFKGFYESQIFGCGAGSKTIDNCYVQILYNSGIIGALGFILLMYFSIKRMHLNNPIKIERFVGFLLAIEILMFTTESWINFFGLYVTLVLGVNLRKIEYKISKCGFS